VRLVRLSVDEGRMKYNLVSISGDEGRMKCDLVKNVSDRGRSRSIWASRRSISSMSFEPAEYAVYISHVMVFNKYDNAFMPEERTHILGKTRRGRW
jgi:hypothetical protein